MAALEQIVRVTISGVVQGVGYRAWTLNAAAVHGVTGWVRNRADGRVEAVFAGPAHSVTSICEACRSGPAAAQVAEIEIAVADRTALAETGGGRIWLRGD